MCVRAPASPKREAASSITQFSILHLIFIIIRLHLKFFICICWIFIYNRHFMSKRIMWWAFPPRDSQFLQDSLQNVLARRTLELRVHRFCQRHRQGILFRIYFIKGYMADKRFHLYWVSYDSRSDRIYQEMSPVFSNDILYLKTQWKSYKYFVHFYFQHLIFDCLASLYVRISLCAVTTCFIS